jgi:uncharacterized membrane protein
LSKLLSILLFLFIAGAVGALVYTVAKPVGNKPFTEFSILGLDNSADDYPSQFNITGNQAISVTYDAGSTTEGWGYVTVGIVNHENRSATYSLQVKVDNAQVEVNYQGEILPALGQLNIPSGQAWQGQIGFVPGHVGDNQEVEFLRFNGNSKTPENTLHLWINVTAKP